MLLFMYSFVCIAFACSLEKSGYEGTFRPAGKYVSLRAVVIGRVVCLLFLLFSSPFSPALPSHVYTNPDKFLKPPTFLSIMIVFYTNRPFLYTKPINPFTEATSFLNRAPDRFRPRPQGQCIHFFLRNKAGDSVKSLFHTA